MYRNSGPLIRKIFPESVSTHAISRFDLRLCNVLHDAARIAPACKRSVQLCVVLYTRIFSHKYYCAAHSTRTQPSAQTVLYRQIADARCSRVAMPTLSHHCDSDPNTRMCKIFFCLMRIVVACVTFAYSSAMKDGSVVFTGGLYKHTYNLCIFIYYIVLVYT